MQTYANDLRLAAREMTLQSEQLSKTRESAKQSSQEAQQRQTQLKSLHDKVSSLTTENSALTAERDALKSSLASLHNSQKDLTTRLARAEARRTALLAQLAAADVQRLELQAKLRDDDPRRLAALNRLRRPPPAPSWPSSLSPIHIGKSPSEAQLLSLFPDMSVEPSEQDELVRDFEREALEMETSLEHHVELARAHPAFPSIYPSQFSPLPAVQLGAPALDAAATANATSSVGMASSVGKESPTKDIEGVAGCSQPVQDVERSEREACSKCPGQGSKAQATADVVNDVIALPVRRAEEPVVRAVAEQRMRNRSHFLCTAGNRIQEKPVDLVRGVATLHHIGSLPILQRVVATTLFKELEEPAEDPKHHHESGRQANSDAKQPNIEGTGRAVLADEGSSSSYASDEITKLSTHNRQTGSQDDLALRNTVHGEEEQPLALGRAPWVDTLNPAIHTASLSLSSSLCAPVSREMGIVTSSGVMPSGSAEDLASA